MSDFTLSFKSTIDKMGYDLAQSLVPSLDFIDLDDTLVSAELFKSNKNALVWEFLTLDEFPTDPLYTFSFRIGARTVKDVANYGVLKMVDDVKTVFQARSNTDIKNYSGDVAGPVVGTMYISNIGVDPQQFDKESGMRMIIVSGRAIRDG